MLRLVGLVGALCILGTLGSTPAHAELCGDANHDGVVNDTDAVLAFRAAAQLSSTAVNRTSDLDLNGILNDTDGVLALRIAAALPSTASCVATQVEGLSQRSSPVLRIGASAIPGGARIAQSTQPCPGGGFISSGANRDEHFDCTEDGIVTNGVIVFTDHVDVVDATFQSFSLRAVATGEFVTLNGTLRFDFTDEHVMVLGAIDASSNFLGTFTDTYRDIELSDDGLLDQGGIFTEVHTGTGAFAHIATIDFLFWDFGTITELIVNFTGGAEERFVEAEGLCDGCSTDAQCSDSVGVGCLPCLQNCGGAQRRCSVDFTLVDCGDGDFGPRSLCQSCTNAGNCGGLLGCFPCNSGCSGNVKRCSSNIKFVECDDGFF
jgi:hypothetical protein